MSHEDPLPRRRLLSPRRRDECERLLVATEDVDALYWVVRLAVRHGAVDAARLTGSSPGPTGAAGPPET